MGQDFALSSSLLYKVEKKTERKTRRVGKTVKRKNFNSESDMES